MALILVIETATKNCSLALCENGITIESIDYNAQKIQPNIIIISNNNENALINFQNLNDNYLIITNLKKPPLNQNNFPKFLNMPISINSLKNSVSSFAQNFKIQFLSLNCNFNSISCKIRFRPGD